MKKKKIKFKPFIKLIQMNNLHGARSINFIKTINKSKALTKQKQTLKKITCYISIFDIVFESK